MMENKEIQTIKMQMTVLGLRVEEVEAKLEQITKLADKILDFLENDKNFNFERGD